MYQAYPVRKAFLEPSPRLGRMRERTAGSVVAWHGVWSESGGFYFDGELA